MYDFNYVKPGSIPEAVKAMGADSEAKALAGGQTFIPVLKQRLNKPSTVIDLAALGMTGIAAEPGKITIGAMTTHHLIESNPDIQQRIPGLAKMASWIGDTQVRHRGTMGGSLANNDPSACYPAAVLAIGATIHTDRRSIAADDFFQGMFTTALEPGELITAVEFPIPEKSNYEKFRNPASRYAMVGVFVARGPAGTRVAITGAGQGGVFRHTAMEQALTANWSADAIKDIKTPSTDLNGDIHASPEYRAHLIGVMARRAVAAA
ncbi:MAG: xanthine dehydrogenase family protein subunit M [Acetobacteraceae bacterium]